MEIPAIILSQALEKSKSSSFHEGLNNVLRKLQSKPHSYFLTGEKGEETRTTDDEIRELINTCVFHSFIADADKIDVVAKIIFTVREYLQKGILNADVGSILIFLSVNCYLRLEFKSIIGKEELDELYTNPVSKEIIKILTSITLTTEALPDAPYHEKEILNEYVEGFANNNIAKAYVMINSVERGGRGFHFNYLLENLISFLYDLNFNSFIKILLRLVNPTDFVFYLQSFEKVELINISNERLLLNKWLNFEIIRQIVEKESKEGFDQTEIEAVETILKRIKVTDFGFFKQTLQYFHNSCLFNAALGILLVSCSNSEIEEVTTESFFIDRYSLNLKARDFLKEYFVKFASNEQIDLLYTLVFQKWKKYFEGLFTSEDFYLNEILLTDFCNFVIHFHTRSIENNNVISMIKSLMNNIKFIDSEWASSKSRQITKFHLYHSELFLLTFAYKNKGLNEPEILTNYDELINNTSQLSRYVLEGTINNFKRGRQNLY